jgi:hypothetical protein
MGKFELRQGDQAPMIDGVEVTASAAELNAGSGVASGQAVTFEIALAASATTDGMDITITAKDANGETVEAAIPFEWWISEDAAGIGLTADSYSGTVTASVGAILTALTAKKHFKAITAATGIFTATAVDSANPADQYVVAAKPISGLGVVVSDASGTSWEGAA